MAKTIQNSVGTHPGLAAVVGTEAALRTNDAAAQYAHFPAHFVSQGAETIQLLDINFNAPYVAAHYTETLDNSGAFAPAAAGMAFTMGAVADNDAFAISTRAHTMAADKVFTCLARVALEDADKDGFWFGFWTTADAEIAQAEPADGVYFESGSAVATMIGTVRGASGTSADTGTLATFSDSVGGLTNTVEVGIQFAANTDVNKCWGKWWVDGTVTVFTAAQLAQLDAMITTTPPVLCCGIGCTPSDTGTDVVTIQYAWGGADR